MQVVSQRHAQQAYRLASEAGCPCCQGNLVRERRRIVDRLRGLIRPLKRYRCENFACQWVGNLANTDAGGPGSGIAGGAHSKGDQDPRSRSVPTSFIVHMILVAAGVVFVLVYSTMEPVASFDESENALGQVVLQ